MKDLSRSAHRRRYSLKTIALVVLGVMAATAQNFPARPQGRPAQSSATGATVSLGDALWAQAKQALAKRDWDKAFDLFQQVSDNTDRRSGPQDPEHTNIWTWQASIRRDQGRPAAAERLDRRALVLASETLDANHPAALVSLSNLALDLRLLGRVAEAEPLDRQAFEIVKRVLGEKHPFAAMHLSIWAGDLRELGRYTEAEALDRRALAYRIEKLGENHAETLTSLSNLAVDLNLLGRLVEGEQLDRRALALSKTLLGEKHPDTQVSRNNLAVTLRDLGRYADAEPLFRQALEIRTEVLGEKHPDTLVSLNNLAVDLAQQGRVAEAERLHRRALALRTEVLGAAHAATLTSMNNLATDLGDLGRTNEAEELDRRVLALRIKVLGPKHPDTLTSAQSLALDQLVLTGEAQNALANARLAREGFATRYAALSADGVRGEVQQTRDRGTLQAAQRLFADAAWVRGQAQPGELPNLRLETFAALQDANAGTTARAIAETAARRYAARQGAVLIDNRRALLGRWRSADRRENDAIAAGNSTARDAARAEVDGVAGQIQAIDKDLRVKAPQYFAIINQTAVSLAETQAMLRADEAVLLVVPTQFGTHLMAVSREGLTWHRSSLSGGQINVMVHRLRCDLDPAGEQGCDAAHLATPQADASKSRSTFSVRAATRAKLAPFDLETAHALYAAVIAPIASAISNKSTLYIAATGSLASLPFSVLVTDVPPTGADGSDPDTLRRTPWFGDTHALVQIPSLQALAYLRTYNHRDGGNRARIGATFAGYGDPLLTGVSAKRGERGSTVLRSVDALELVNRGAFSSAAALMDPARLRALARLPGTQSELLAMRAHFHVSEATLHMEERMTETALKEASADGSLARTRILHFATHGIAAHELDLAEPGLVFTPPSTASDLDDGYLSASEVVNLDLAGADWVILSACNTAAPSDRGEPGLSGLARAFFYAGAPTLLVSHWPVFDDVAAILTVDTLERAAASTVSRARALQQAVIALRNDGKAAHAHPSAWAPFVLAGEGT